MLRFRAQTPPQKYDAEFLFRQLLNLQSVVDLLAAGNIEPSAVAPDKPRDGMIRYADGTNWDPGRGRGLYIYVTNEWIYLGGNAPASIQDRSKTRLYFYAHFRGRVV